MIDLAEFGVLLFKGLAGFALIPVDGMAEEEIGVAAVPGSSFYPDPVDGRRTIRFAFPKRLETLRAAADRLARLAG